MAMKSNQTGPERIHFLSSNGVGLGHLVRQMAIARRMEARWRPLFATMSYAARQASQYGYPTLFFPHHNALGTGHESWNSELELELELLIRHAPPAALVYDATAVYGGVVETMARHRDIYSVWVRRPMWQESNRKFLALSDRFNAVIEPSELAEELDHGPTTEFRQQVYRVPPILMLSPAERLSRAEARRELDLPESATVVAVQLGSGANFDMEPVRRGVTQALLRHPGVIVLDLRSPVASTTPPPAPAGPRHRTATLFPAFRYSLAFDVAVSAPGYNTFHESLLGGIPTLFVPNEAEEMDQQLSRAQWAEQSGMGLLLRRGDPSAAAERMIEQLLDPATRQRMTERCGEIAWADGALAVAHLIEKNVLRAE